MLINKDTQIFGSFSTQPGNNGCEFFNKKFYTNNINAIYKSFYSDNIQQSIEAVKILDIKGFAVSMPFKIEVLKYVNEIDIVAQEIGSANTIINNNGYLKAYNTDWIGVKKYLKDIDFLTILGNGGFSKAVRYACDKLHIPYSVITRDDWQRVYTLTGYVFNATPIDITTKGTLIDARPFKGHGKTISTLIADEQYNLYINNI